MAVAHLPHVVIVVVIVAYLSFLLFALQVSLRPGGPPDARLLVEWLQLATAGGAILVAYLIYWLTHRQSRVVLRPQSFVLNWAHQKHLPPGDRFPAPEYGVFLDIETTPGLTNVKVYGLDMRFIDATGKTFRHDKDLDQWPVGEPAFSRTPWGTVWRPTFQDDIPPGSHLGLGYLEITPVDEPVAMSWVVKGETGWTSWGWATLRPPGTRFGRFVFALRRRVAGRRDRA